MILYFETHSISLDNDVSIASGWYDVALSPIGEGQARDLGRRYADIPLAAVYTSDLQRAVRTAALAFGPRIASVADRRLRECDYGELTRQRAVVVEGQRLARIDDPFPAGESYRDVIARVAGWLSYVRHRHDGETVLVIGHRATWYAFEHLLNGRDLREVVAGRWAWQPGWRYAVS